MADKKNQHFVPKVYLRAFASDEERRRLNVWLPKYDRVVQGASVKSQCSKSYFYGEDLVLEDSFHFPERLYGGRLDSIVASGTIDKNGLEELLLFWLVQSMRAEAFISSQVLAFSVVREKVLLGFENDEDALRYVGPPMTQEDAAKSAFSNAPEVFNLVSDLKCVLLDNVSKFPFITTDNPAVSSNRLILQRYMKYRNWGLSSAGLYLYLPLTPKYGFLAYDRSVYELAGRHGIICRVNEGDVRCLNETVFMSSVNCVFFHDMAYVGKIVDQLKGISELKPETLFQVHVAVLDKNDREDGYKRFVVSTDDEFKGAKSGLLHLESTPPKLRKHFPKLRFRQNPKYVDTRTGAGLKRHTVDDHLL